MARYRTLDDLQPHGLRVLVRVDLNVPMKNGVVSDATRIHQAATTVCELSDKGARVILLAHFGRPDGKRVEAMSLKPLIPELEKIFARSVAFAPDCIGPAVETATAGLKDGQILLLENTRFHAEEEANAPAFVAALTRLGDIYVNDAFSAAHRAHATTEGLAHKLPAYAGRGMQAELEALDAALGNPQRPVAAHDPPRRQAGPGPPPSARRPPSRSRRPGDGWPLSSRRCS